MGKEFGHLAKVYGIVTYKLSPFEQRAFAGAISKGVPNMFRRFRSNVFTIAPRKWSEADMNAVHCVFLTDCIFCDFAAFIIGYLVYDYVESLHTKLSRKNPADFANDV